MGSSKKSSTKKSKTSKTGSLPPLKDAPPTEVESAGLESAFMAVENDINENGIYVDPKKDEFMDGEENENTLPGESADGRMGADIQLLIEDITDYRDLLNRHTAEDKANLAAIDKEIEVLEYRQQKIESRLQKRQTAKAEYTKTLLDTERAFNAIVNTANSVANILKPPTEGELEAMDVPDTVRKIDEDEFKKSRK